MSARKPGPVPEEFLDGAEIQRGTSLAGKLRDNLRGSSLEGTSSLKLALFPQQEGIPAFNVQGCPLPTLGDSQKVKQVITINESDSKNGYAGKTKTQIHFIDSGAKRRKISKTLQ